MQIGQGLIISQHPDAQMGRENAGKLLCFFNKQPYIFPAVISKAAIRFIFIQQIIYCVILRFPGKGKIVTGIEMQSAFMESFHPFPLHQVACRIADFCNGIIIITIALHLKKQSPARSQPLHCLVELHTECIQRRSG